MAKRQTYKPGDSLLDRGYGYWADELDYFEKVPAADVLNDLAAEIADRKIDFWNPKPDQYHWYTVYHVLMTIRDKVLLETGDDELTKRVANYRKDD